MKLILSILLIPFLAIGAVRGAVRGLQFGPPANRNAGVATTYYGVTNQPIFWIKADAQGLNDGDAVTTAVDSSGRGTSSEFGQATAGKKPTYKTGALNSLPTLRFDGGDCLTNPSIAMSTFTTFIVTSNSSAGVLWEHSASALLNDGNLIYASDACSIYTTRSVSSGKQDSANWGVGKWVIARVDFNGNNSGHLLSTNGVATSASLCAANADPGTGTVTTQGNIGSKDNAFSSALTGHISEILTFSPALVGADINTVQTNIQAKYFP